MSMQEILFGLGLSGVGLCVGFFIGLTGLGGGVIVVPILVLLYKFDQTMAQGTSLSIILSPLQIPALINYARAGNINWSFLFWMCPGILLGSFLGSMLANVLPKETLKYVFALFLVYTGVYSLFMFLGIRVSLVLALLMTLVMALTAGLVRRQMMIHEPAPAKDVETID